MACQANHAAAAAKTTRQAVTGMGVSRGSSIPAIAKPIKMCSASASRSVVRPDRREMARRAAQYTAVTTMTVTLAGAIVMTFESLRRVCSASWV